MESVSKNARPREDTQYIPGPAREGLVSTILLIKGLRHTEVQ